MFLPARLAPRWFHVAICAATCLSLYVPADAQQQPGGGQPAGAAQAATAPLGAGQAPAGFELNQLEQAYLDQVLASWERESAKIITFKCPFERWEYDPAFGPAPDVPINKDKGELSYQKPDKGSFQITEVNKWQAKPAAPGEQPPAKVQGDWVTQPDAVGEHWVCDGKSVFEYRHDQKQLVERPIPPQLQGKAIVDGPLPFLFGAEAAKLKARYWMRIQPQADPNLIWLQAKPKFQEDAANYQAVELMLDRQQLLPTAMRVHLPNGSSHLYLFSLKDASVNGHLDRLMTLFQAPRTPFGWKRVVEDLPPDPAPPGPPREAAQPGEQAR
jgi:TIGR03009 family protein